MQSYWPETVRRLLRQFSLNTGNIIRVLGISVVDHLNCLTEGVNIGILNDFNTVVLDLLELAGFLLGNPGALVLGCFLCGIDEDLLGLFVERVAVE